MTGGQGLVRKKRARTPFKKILGKESKEGETNKGKKGKALPGAIVVEEEASDLGRAQRLGGKPFKVPVGFLK